MPELILFSLFEGMKHEGWREAILMFMGYLFVLSVYVMTLIGIIYVGVFLVKKYARRSKVLDLPILKKL